MCLPAGRRALCIYLHLHIIDINNLANISMCTYIYIYLYIRVYVHAFPSSGGYSRGHLKPLALPRAMVPAGSRTEPSVAEPRAWLRSVVLLGCGQGYQYHVWGPLL